MNKVVEIKNITKVFSTEEVDTYALRDVSLDIEKSEYLVISGPSGSGKSTMLSILGLLEKPSEGSYFIDGNDSTKLNVDQLCDLRNRKIGFIFQSFNLIDSLTVIENVMLPIVYRVGVSKKDAEQKAMTALERVGMQHRAKHYPAQLSGGQQQRVAVARALITEPSIILADEPTGNLDSSSAEMVMDLLKAQHEQGATICMVTHDPRYTRDATRTLQFSDGVIQV